MRFSYDGIVVNPYEKIPAYGIFYLQLMSYARKRAVIKSYELVAKEFFVPFKAGTLFVVELEILDCVILSEPRLENQSDWSGVKIYPACAGIKRKPDA